VGARRRSARERARRRRATREYKRAKGRLREAQWFAAVALAGIAGALFFGLFPLLIPAGAMLIGLGVVVLAGWVHEPRRTQVGPWVILFGLAAVGLGLEYVHPVGLWKLLALPVTLLIAVVSLANGVTGRGWLIRTYQARYRYLFVARAGALFMGAMMLFVAGWSLSLYAWE